MHNKQLKVLISYIAFLDSEVASSASLNVVTTSSQLSFLKPWNNFSKTK